MLIVDELIADAITMAIFTYFSYYLIIKRGFGIFSLVVLLMSGSMILIALSDIVSNIYIQNTMIECWAGRFTAVGALLSGLGLITSLSMFPRKNILYKAIPSLYVISSLFIFYLFSTNHFLYCDPLSGGNRGTLWALYSLWVFDILFLSAFVSTLMIFKTKIKVEKLQFSYMAAGSVILLIYMAVAQILPLYYEDMEYFTVVHILPITALLYSVALVRYGMFITVAQKERREDLNCEVELVHSELNAIWNTHTAYRAFRILISKEPGLIVTVHPPKILKSRYVIERTPILWLTYYPDSYENAVIPDRLQFEVMYSIIHFIDNGGRALLIDGAEYLIENFGRRAFIELLNDIRLVNPNVTVVVATGTDKLLKGFADNVAGKNCKIENPKVIMVKGPTEINEEVIAVFRGERGNAFENSNKNWESIVIDSNYNADQFIFNGIKKIENSKKKSVYVDCLDYLISIAGERRVMNFLKDLIDLTLQRGGMVYLRYTPQAIESPLISSFIESYG